MAEGVGRAARYRKTDSNCNDPGASANAFFVIERPVRHIAFDLENAGTDRERAVGLARSICLVRTPQIDRRWIKESVLRLVWPGRASGRRICIGECKLTAQRNCAAGNSLFYKLIAAVAFRSTEPKEDCG